MGISTVNQLIQRAQNLNSYNNSGIETTAAWVDFFNSALIEMVEDLDIKETVNITFDPVQKTYTLPDDYYSIIYLRDTTNQYDLKMKREREHPEAPGFLISDKGSSYEARIIYSNPSTLELLYLRYPKMVELSKLDDKPEIPTAGETALCFLAISASLLNNNQPGQAQYFRDLYKAEKVKIRTATSRARGV